MTETPTRDRRTITQRLKDAGYGHKADANSDNDGRHVIFDLKTGADLGRFDAIEALKRFAP